MDFFRIEVKSLYTPDNIPIFIQWEAAMKDTDAVKKTMIQGLAAFGANLQATGGKHDYSLLKIDGLKIYTTETE